MSADSAVTYTSVHSEARSWSIPSEDPYEEAARQLLEQAPRSPEYIPDPIELEDYVPVYILEPEHPEDLVPAEDEAPTPLLPPSFLSPPDIPEADTPPRKRLLLTTPRPSVEVGESSAAVLRDCQDPYGPESQLQSGIRHYGAQVSRSERTEDDRPLEIGQPEALIDQGVAAAMAEAEASRVRNGYNSNGSGPRPAQTARECSYSEFLNAYLWTSKGTEEMFPEELDKMKVYRRLASILYIVSVKGSKLENYASRRFEFTTELMDEKTYAYAKRQAERKRKYDDLSKNNQNQQQQNKRHNTGQAYTAGNSDRKSYAGSKPLCSKCNYNHEGPCPPRCNNCKRVGHLTRDCRSRPANANNNNNNNNNNRNNNNNNRRQTVVCVPGSEDILEKKLPQT
ncbi:putative reverse transcriptase domain-containing protein [Tanacetum coccineum]|uniref:Reverse transcriptase domain-containing protein n=1 Tax=Tanacetum coccineum TaxID=301880 RepID=A0ABQ5BKW6_9ASTR